jgi:hypothetical protein
MKDIAKGTRTVQKCATGRAGRQAGKGTVSNGEVCKLEHSPPFRGGWYEVQVAWFWSAFVTEEKWWCRREVQSSKAWPPTV